MVKTVLPYEKYGSTVYVKGTEGVVVINYLQKLKCVVKY